jgi:hypothetical protein
MMGLKNCLYIYAASGCSNIIANWKHILVIALLAGGGVQSFSQSDSIFVIPRISGINFDGKVDDAAWENIAPVKLVQYEPRAGMPPTEKTEIRFAYDDNYFYGSLRGYDSDPNGVRNNSLYRDRLAGSDHFEIVLDTYNDNQSAMIFSTIPSGVRNDVAIINDATGGTISGGGWLNRDFNTFWDAETTITDEGWFAEIRVPFSSLRFQDDDGEVIMGLSVQRKIARKTERIVFPSIGPVTDWAFLRPSLAQKILIRGIKPTKTVYIAPYALAGVNSFSTINSAGTAYERMTESQVEIGGDIKFSITNNLTADFTINTDFAQAEADDQLINLTRFSLFYPEKRQFFQERAGLFEFRNGGLSRLFFSRRIGLTEDGRPIPIIGGVRMVGRVGTWDLGFLNMQTSASGDVPSENFGVLRMRRRVFNEQSFIGGIFTSRFDLDGGENIAYGLDGLINVFGDDFLAVQWAQTFDNIARPENPVESVNNARLAIELNRRRRRGFGYNMGYVYSGKNHNPGLGFQARENFKAGVASISQTWLFDEESPLIWSKIGLAGRAFWNNDNGNLWSAEYGPEWTFSTKRLTTVTFKLNGIYERLFEPFSLFDGAAVPADEYNFVRFTGSYNMAFERILRTSVEIETGSFYDGWLNSLSFSPSWYASKHLELGLQYVLNKGSFDERDENFTVHIVRLRVGTAVNKVVSTNALIQYNSDLDLFSANVRFRCNFREGNDLWFVLNEGLNTNRNLLTPRPPVSVATSLLIKYVYTFQF